MTENQPQAAGPSLVWPTPFLPMSEPIEGMGIRHFAKLSKGELVRCFEGAKQYALSNGIDPADNMLTDAWVIAYCMCDANNNRFYTETAEIHAAADEIQKWPPDVCKHLGGIIVEFISPKKKPAN